MLVILVVLCLACMVCGCAQGEPAQKPENNYMVLESTYCFSNICLESSSINISKFRNSANIHTENGEVVSFFDVNGKATLILLDGKTKHQITIRDDMNRQLLGDGHCSINLGCFHDKIWFAYGAHVTEGYYGCIDVDDFYYISEFTAEKMDEPITYPSFYNIKDRLYFVYRDLNGWSFMDLSDKDKIDFKEARLLIHGDHTDDIYLNDIAVSQNMGYAAMPFVIRKASEDDLIRNEGIYLCYGEGDFNAWKTVRSSKQIEIPISYHDVNKMIDVGPESGLMNQESTYVTDKGMVFITRLTEDLNGIPQLYLTGYDLKTNEEKSYCITNNKDDFLLKGKGTLTLPISRGQVVASDKYVHILYRMNGKLMLSSARYDDGTEK